MVVCARCGRESPDEFGFCPGCGAPLGPVEPPREVRKVVSVLFCDLTGSTAIGERTDPEALRALMTRYYDAARVVLERHGGTVEKFVGDAVMAVFGLPVAREDDALRAVRAAVEMRDVVHELGLEARIGVNTGSVVAGVGDTLVTGDAVNVAARLEQAASAGEILLGSTTHRLVRDAVETEELALELKGKSGSVTALRLVALETGASGLTRRLGRPMIGRERERARLRGDFDDAVAGGTCRLFTVIGPAGVGKTRLVADFLDDVSTTATVAQGRALSYGEGITYFPLVEVLVQLGVPAEEALGSSPADTQLSTRATLERLAAQRPLVVVLDDLQWAEPPLLDVIEHIADWSREAPIFLLCAARPELMDVRPGWGGGKLNATSILLEPLRRETAAELADSLLAGEELDAATRSRILRTAEGNPLFLEELVSLAREVGGSIEIPPTIQAVMQARLDTLGARERMVVDRGAVEGQVFHRSAVIALVAESELDDVPAQLHSLVRKEVVRPDKAQVAGDEAFRFRHLLIRDTAYEALPKAVRAELHRQFAAWFDMHVGLLEHDEIVGYHLEQAARYRSELDPFDALASELGASAAERLALAGRSAHERNDLHGARNLLTRAVDLLPDGEARRRLVPDLVDVLGTAGDVEEACRLISELDGGDVRDRAQANVLRVLWQPLVEADQMTEAAAAREILLAAGDLAGAARCERARALVAWGLCQAGDSHVAYRASREHLHRAGSAAWQQVLSAAIQLTAYYSGRSATEIATLLDDLFAGNGKEGPLQTAARRSARARLAFATGAISFEELQRTLEHEVDLLRQTGSELGAAWVVGGYMNIAVSLTQDAEAVERHRRERVRQLERLGALTAPVLANSIGHWARSLAVIGDLASAREAIVRARTMALPGDLYDEAVLSQAEALVAAVDGDESTARTALEQAHATADGIDMAPLIDDLTFDSALVEAHLGNVARARSLLDGLVERTQERGFHRFADRYRRELAALG